MNELILVSPPAFSSLSHPPLGTAILTAYLRSKKIPTKQINFDSLLMEWIIEKSIYKHSIKNNINVYNLLQTKKEDLTESEFSNYWKLINIFREGINVKINNENRISKIGVFTPELNKDAIKEIAFSEIERFLANHKLIYNCLTLDGVIDKFNDQNDLTKQLLIDFFEDRKIKKIIDQLLKAKLVGFSIYSSDHIFPAICLSKILKKREPTLRIIFGGPQISLLNKKEKEKLLDLEFADYIGLYEGEITIEKLYHFICGTGKIEEIPNILYKKSDCSFSQTLIVPPIHINCLPTPIFDKRHMDIYSKYLFVSRQDSIISQVKYKQLPVYATRGCFWNKCTFCDYIHIFSQSKYTERDPHRVVEDIIKLQKKHCVFSFYLTGEALPIPWIKKFCKEIINRRVEATFSCFLRHTDKKNLSKEVIDLMKIAGFIYPIFGTESYVDRILDSMGKGVKYNAIEDNYNMLKVGNLDSQCNLIPDFPSITKEEMKELINKMISFRDIIPNILAQTFDLSSLSEIAKYPERFGIKIEGKMARSHGIHSLKFSRTAGLTNEERDRYVSMFFIILNQWNLYNKTVHDRERIESKGFNWMSSMFSFVNLLIIPSSYSLIEKGKKKNVYLLCSIEDSVVLELPYIYKNIYSLIINNMGDLITFNDFFEAYKNDIHSNNDDRSENAILQACIADITEYVYSGIIKNVTNKGNLNQPHFDKYEIMDHGMKLFPPNIWKNK